MADSTMDEIYYMKHVDVVREIVEKAGGSRDEKLQTIVTHLDKNFEEFDWVGFYVVDPEANRELVLGPYVGAETEHTRIPFGNGICGQAADTEQTFVVQDVSQESNYLSCNINVKSEVVVPVMRDGKFVAELDIDSHQKDAISATHQKMLEEICDAVASLF